MEIIYLKKEMVTENVLTNDGTLAYVALRIFIDESAVLRGKERTIDCVSVNRLAYLLVQEMKYDKALLDALVRGIAELSCGNYISIRKDLSNKNNYEYILDIMPLYFTIDEDNYSVNITKDEVYKILTCKEVSFMSKRIAMLKYFIVLVSTFDFRSSMKFIADMPNLQGKITHMPQSYIAEQADTSPKSCHRYNEILVNMKMIYIYKSNDKVHKGDKLKQINNCYSRYEDRKLCEMYAANYENLYGSNHKIVYTQKKKAQADNNRKLGQLYNCICAGYEYDENIIREVRKYIVKL